MRRSLLLLLALVAVGGVTWWLFGWRSQDNPALGRIRYQRHLGKYTQVILDSNRDGHADMEVQYSWATPYIGIVDGPCGDSFLSTREDRNFDGRWDTWTVRLPPSESEPCPLRIEADTKGLGRADWSREIASGESQAVYAHLKEIRGF